MMKKRVYCLILGLLMLILSFAGCGGEEVGFDEEEERLAMTINLMIPTNSSTTAEAVSAVQDALNNIFNSKRAVFHFKTVQNISFMKLQKFYPSGMICFNKKNSVF